MLPVLTAAAMREADRRAIQERGIPGVVLMEKAGSAVAEVVRPLLAPAARLLVLCGRGNNGGDGFVAAHRLRDRRPEVVLLAPMSAVTGDAALHLRALVEAGGAVREVLDPAAWEAFASEVERPDVVVDALLGTGLRDAPRGVHAAAIADVNRWRDAGTAVVAVDVPSGLGSDGTTRGESVRATHTVT
ncbi:MAG TPA: NAD(P)H-hydrate epimerase, partial [Vicinamibacteria bacterium]|nr:NAD(P)H-hydrate epimerase [Vicinamibacteria bacterium]